MNLSGNKSYIAGSIAIIGGIISILTGVVGLIAHFGDPLNKVALDPDTALGMIVAGWAGVSGGLSVIGIRHAIQKNTDAIEVQTETIVAPEPAPLTPEQLKELFAKIANKTASAAELQAAMKSIGDFLTKPGAA